MVDPAALRAVEKLEVAARALETVRDEWQQIMAAPELAAGQQATIDALREAAAALAALLEERERFSQPDMICEVHPELAWPHDDCPGPGCPGANPVDGLVYQRNRARADALRLSEAAKDARVLLHEVRYFVDNVDTNEMADEQLTLRRKVARMIAALDLALL